MVETIILSDIGIGDRCGRRRMVIVKGAGKSVQLRGGMKGFNRERGLGMRVPGVYMRGAIVHKAMGVAKWRNECMITLRHHPHLHLGLGAPARAPRRRD